MKDSSRVSIDGNGRAASYRSRGYSGHMCCLFSSYKIIKIGSGATSARHTSKLYWFVRQIGETRYGVRAINSASLPWGEETVVSASILHADYTPEIAHFEGTMLPSIRRHKYQPDWGNSGQSGGFPFPIGIDESNVRALFDLGLEYIGEDRINNGKRIVNQLLNLRTPFTGKDQFLFNEFGIALRKVGLHDTAVSYYKRALNYTDKDDHLYYNLARAHYEQGQWWDCMEALGKCFEFNPELTVSRGLVELIVAMAQSPRLLERHEKPPVPGGVARRARLLAETFVFSGPLDTGIMPVNLERRRVWSGEDNQYGGKG
ncbi:tetratricopeptide repeat protein, partial [Pseudodesulfovibrio sp.]|nr:tetratricopeptide repeat protein [Pseudodesulfovibrio sp.]